MSISGTLATTTDDYFVYVDVHIFPATYEAMLFWLPVTASLTVYSIALLILWNFDKILSKFHCFWSLKIK